MATAADKDLDRIIAFRGRIRAKYPTIRAAFLDQEVADLIATVRRETVEECLRIADRSWAHDVPRRIRALLDEPEAMKPARAPCRYCKQQPDYYAHRLYDTTAHHTYEPEPGHE